MTSDIATFIARADRDFVPHVSVDCTVVAFDGRDLQVLLLRLSGSRRWMLPGGFVHWDESLDDAAERTLRERTGLDHIHLEQFHAFGAPDRGQAQMREAIGAMGVKLPRDHWIAERHVTIGYLALVSYSNVRPTLGAFSEEWGWFPARKLPRMGLDHADIVASALETLQDRARAYQLGRELMPAKFTMTELQRLYEAVLDRELDRRNFRKKILEIGLVRPLKERRTGRPHRASILYRFARA